MRRFARPFLLSATLLASACSAETSPATAPSSVPSTAPATQPTVSMTLGKTEIALEVAADDASRELGLMNRDSMPVDHGMIFIFGKSDTWGFWMKNTKIPLDLLYVSASGKIVDIATLKAMDETTYYPVARARYVIELNAGAAKTLKLNIGDALTLPDKLPPGK